MFFLIGFVDNLFYPITIAYPNIQLISTHIWNNNLVFNWSAKLYSILFVLILLILLKKIITLDDIGLKFKQNKNSLLFSLLLTLIIFIVASTLALLSVKKPFDTNTLLFTAIMPGLNEELIYRGLLLGLLNKIFEKRFKLFATNFGWGAILTSLVFGLLHGFSLSNSYQFQFDLITIFFTGIYGFIYALIKERSGSLVFPIIAHSTADFFNFFFRMI